MLNILIILCNAERFPLHRKRKALGPLQDQNSKAGTTQEKGPALFSYSERSDNGVETTQEKTALIAEESKHEWKQIRFKEATWN